MQLYFVLSLLLVVPSYTNGAPMLHDAKPGAAAGPHLVPIRNVKAGTKASRKHIIKVKPGVAIKTVFKTTAITNDLSHINAFAGIFAPAVLEEFSKDPNVIEIVQGRLLRSFNGKTVQGKGPWGLARLSSTEKNLPPAGKLDHVHTFPEHLGECADIYIVDSGIHKDHKDFEGRLTVSPNFCSFETELEDIVGHGTHVASIAAGTLYGVAKKAHIYSVKVSGDARKVDPECKEAGHAAGDEVDAIQAYKWIIEQVKKTGKPSIVNISSGFGAEDVDPHADAVLELIKEGIHVVVASGDSSMDVVHISPANIPTVITVGSSALDNTVPTIANFGPLIDVFAPGEHTLMAGLGAKDAQEDMVGGSSMAAPHVAGLATFHLCKEGNHKMTPHDLQKKIVDDALKGVLHPVTPHPGTNYILAHLPPTPADAPAVQVPS